MVIERSRNRAQDLRTYHFKYLDRSWAKAPGMRQLVVVATNPEGKSIEVPVLTDDLKRPAVEVLKPTGNSGPRFKKRNRAWNN